MSIDSTMERTVVGIAHALFINRLHVLRLTEVVRLGIKPSTEDENMVIPSKLDDELKQQAIDYVLTCLPSEYSALINHAKADWLNPA
jgi:hypothetical protein